MTLQLIEDEGSTHPVRFQALCTACGYHWPLGGYVMRGSACLAYERHLHACESVVECDPDCELQGSEVVHRPMCARWEP